MRLQGRTFRRWATIFISLQWRHNERDGVLNNRRLDYLLNLFSGADQRKHQSFASLTLVRGIHRWPVDSPHKGPATQKIFPYDDVIVNVLYLVYFHSELVLFMTVIYIFRCFLLTSKRKSLDKRMPNQTNVCIHFMLLSFVNKYNVNFVYRWLKILLFILFTFVIKCLFFMRCLPFYIHTNTTQSQLCCVIYRHPFAKSV